MNHSLHANNVLIRKVVGMRGVVLFVSNVKIKRAMTQKCLNLKIFLFTECYCVASLADKFIMKRNLFS